MEFMNEIQTEELIERTEQIELMEQNQENEQMHTIEPERISIGDTVKVIQPTEDMDAEDYYYLESFLKKKGKVVDIKGQPKNYYVDFGEEHEGIFYKSDLKKIDA